MAVPGNRFLFLLAPSRALPPGQVDQRPWLASWDTDTGLTPCRRLAIRSDDLPILLGGPHPMVLNRDRIHPVTTDLTLGPRVGPGELQGATTTPGRVWLVGRSNAADGSLTLSEHRPETLGEVGRHSLPGRPDQVVATSDSTWVRVNGTINRLNTDTRDVIEPGAWT